MSTPRKSPITQHSSNRRSSRSARSTSITQSLETHRIKRSLTKRAAVTSTSNLDDAVPLALRAKQLLQAAQTDLHIRHIRHALSPFVLNLQTAQELSSTQTATDATIRVNLLHPSLSRTPQLPLVPEQTLTLHPTDLLNQLREDEPQVSLPAIRQTATHPSPTVCVGSFCVQNQSRVSLEVFTPKPTPVDIYAYFDLPEEEDEADESELVELNASAEFHPIEEPPIKPHKAPAWSWPRISLPTLPTAIRPIGAFILLSFIFVLPLHAMNLVSGLKQSKQAIESNSTEAFSLLQDGISGQTQAFAQANARFASAEQSLTELGVGTSLLLSTLPQTKGKMNAGVHLVRVGDHLTRAGEYLTEALEAIAHETNPTPVSRLRLLKSYLAPALPQLTQAQKELLKVDVEEIPAPHKATFAQMQTALPKVVETVQEFDELSDLAISILGGEQTKRYLLIFQNNTEIRATGGFMGSFAELKVRNGVLEQLSVPGGGTYDLQGQVRVPRVSPLPLQLLSARWEFQDANWFPDFPTSARQMIEFYRDAGGPSVDGVIAINATYVAELIALLGPIDMPEYNRTIDAENFLFETQKIVEVEYDRTENKPKQFIGDLAPKLIDRIVEGTPQDFLALMDQVSTGLAQKDIQLYFEDAPAQKAMIAHHWAGAIEPSSKDYLMVVNTNLGGGKTDGVIDEQIHVDVAIAPSGTLINTVTISRTHLGMNGTQFTGVNNVNYVRVYVPRGSELISATGFRIPDKSLFEYPEEDWLFDDDLQYSAITATRDEKSGTDVYEEQGKTVFGNWVQTAPGETSTITFQYKLPFQLFDANTSFTDRLKTAAGLDPTDTYSLTLQKQAGTINRRTSLTVSLPDSMRTLWQTHERTKVEFSNETDALFATLLSYPL